MDELLFDKKLRLIITSSIILLIFSNSLLFPSFAGSFSLIGIDLSSDQSYVKGYPPVPIIEGLDGGIIDVLNNQNIHLDASRSYDKDGKIVEYLWNIGSDTLFGNVLDYKVKINKNMFDQDDPPVIYLSLVVIDESGNSAMRDILIRVISNKFYLSRECLSSSRGDGEILSIIRKSEIVYSLSRPIRVSPCKVRLHISLDKKLSLGLKEIKFYVLGKNGEELLISSKMIGVISQGRIDLIGRIEKEIDVSAFKITVRGIPFCKFTIDNDDSYVEFF